MVRTYPAGVAAGPSYIEPSKLCTTNNTESVQLREIPQSLEY
jgi:hypothetical protein